MKLNFDSVVYDIILQISELPEKPSSIEDLNKPLSIINKALFFYTPKNAVKLKIPTKLFVKVRTQISFLLTLEHGLQNNNVSNELKYDYWRKLCINVVNGEALKNLNFIKLGLRYSVIELSEEEIRKLL